MLLEIKKEEAELFKEGSSDSDIDSLQDETEEHVEGQVQESGEG